MEQKSNESTPNRPEGSRVLDANLVEMDLNGFIQKLRTEPAWISGDRNTVTVFKSESMRIVLLGLHQGAELKSHKANGVISVQVLEGQVEFSTDLQTCLLGKGQMIALHENIMHSVQARVESFFLLTLSINK
ncbi:MAG: hypothetical protein EOP49_46645 [Sphingobacteriales bacterium]|nr:MAG: hypothetical protein EOP49_46645 [Sphingobacteriales bacterium]